MGDVRIAYLITGIASIGRHAIFAIGRAISESTEARPCLVQLSQSQDA